MIAVDVGLKRIGLAQNRMGIIVPLKPIIRKNRNQAARELSSLIFELKPQVLIVGIPSGGECEEEMSRRIKHFISLIHADDIDVVYIDESFSTFEAEEKLKEIKKDRKSGTIDSIAACIILERYLMRQK